MSRHKNIDYNQKVLEVRNLYQHFKVGTGSRKLVVKAVDGVSFDIYKREVFGLVGESGCGKTTTGRCIIKLYDITDGTIKYNGRIISAGLQGNKYRIRKAKLACKNEITEHRPLAKKIKNIKDEANNEIVLMNAEIEKLQKQQENEIIRINKIINDYEEKVSIALHAFESKRNKVRLEEKAEIDRIRQRDVLDLFRIYNKTLHLIEQKSKLKIAYIKGLPIPENEKIERLAEENEVHKENIAQTIDRLINKLSEVSPDILAQYEDQIRQGHKIKFKPEVNLKDPEIVEKINAVKVKYQKIYEQLEAEHQVEIAKIDENKPDKEALENEIKQLKLSTAQKIKEINAKIKEINQQAKQRINEVKQHAKEHPELYVDNLEEIEKIKQKYQAIIDEEKRQLKINRYYNKLKETPEEKAERIRKLKQLKEEFNLFKQKALARGESKEVIAEEKRKLKKKIKEINAQKPSYARNMSTMQMVFQDPISSLNPRMTVREIISEGLVVRGERNKAIINEKVNRVLELVGLSRDHATRYPHEFSGGQRQRIGIARALVVDPDLIIADEPISALDVSIQAQIINLLNDLKEQLGLTILFIAHDLSVVKYFCDRIAVMYYGKIVELASSEELFANPLHPYTKALLSAIPHPDPDYEAKRVRITYDPSVHNYLHDKPELVEIKPGHFVYANKEEQAKYKQQLGIE